MSDDRAVVARCSRQLSTITGLFFDVADDGTFWHESDGENVADGELGFLAAVHELAGVHTLNSDEEFLADLVSVWIAEVDDSQRSATARVVDDFLQ